MNVFLLFIFLIIKILYYIYKIGASLFMFSKFYLILLSTKYSQGTQTLTRIESY